MGGRLSCGRMPTGDNDDHDEPTGAARSHPVERDAGKSSTRLDGEYFTLAAYSFTSYRVSSSRRPPWTCVRPAVSGRAEPQQLVG